MGKPHHVSIVLRIFIITSVFALLPSLSFTESDLSELSIEELMNISSAECSGLKVSSQLLKYAEIIHTNDTALED
jgi:hypothetical protein